MLPSHRWPDVERVFHAASEPGADVEACLSGIDPDVAVEVRALLSVDDEADAFFARPGLLAPFADDAEAVLTPGTRVGVWTVGEELGRGGMGLVYRAHRADGAYDQTVALKVVHAPGPSTRGIDRFVRERALLASLRHPHIARLLDGGTTADGLPYLAMELVEGVPITEHAQTLPPRARLTLFLDVCAAVAHAHRRLVVHCDIKPSNVLVDVPDDGVPVVKLLDFGIARALGLGDGGDPAGEVRYTPRYAAPEQVGGGPIGTATDVFALGVLLADLVGIDRRRAGGAAPPANDLAAIVARATDADPDQRYPSVDALADGVRRHLGDWPVRARLPTPGYVAGRFLRRHRWQMAAAAAFLLVLFAGALVITLQSHRIAHERDVSGNVAALLENLFLEIDPGGRVTGTTSVRALLDTGASEAARVPDPETKARLLDVLGRVYRALAVYDRALPMQREAVRLYTDTRGPRDAETLRATHHLAYLLEQMNQDAEAERLYRAVLAERRRSGTPTDLVESLSDLASLYVQTRRPADARPLAEEGLAVMDRHPDAGTKGLSGPLARAAFVLLLGDLDLAEKRPGHGVERMREAVDLYARSRGDDHTYTAVARAHLAKSLAAEGRFADADRLLTASAHAQERTWGLAHPWTLAAINSRAEVLVEATAAGALPHARDSAAAVIDRLATRARTAGDAARLRAAQRHLRALDSLAGPAGAP